MGVPSIYSSARTELAKLLIYGLFRKIRVLAQDEVVICMVTTRPPKTIVKPTALGPVANADTNLLIYGLFQKGRVLAQDGTLQSAELSGNWPGTHFRESGNRFTERLSECL